MASYHFPIIVGDRQTERIIMVHLFDTEKPENYQEKRVIFTQCTNPFFKVPENFLLIPNDTNAQNPRPCILTTQLDNQNPRLVSVLVKGKQNRKNGPEELCLMSESNQNDPAYKIFKDEYIEDGKIVELTFSCEVNNRKYTGTLHLIYCPDYEISYTNIDLGSDVTQVSTYRGDDFPEAKQLVQLLKTALNYTGEDQYLSQYYANNENFYRTGNILFKNGGVLTKDHINYLSLNLDGINHYAIKTSNQDEVGAAIDTIDSTTYKTYPNIKILYKMGSFRDVFPFRRSEGAAPIPMGPNSFFDVMSEIYKKLIRITTHRQERFHSVLLLVPNIYNQLQVDELVYNLSRTMNGNLSGPTYYDFRVISESDAAFMGNKRNLRVNWTNNLKDDFFLMIDSGRGTTDFSIISHSMENTFTAVRRGGIVGAGGSIDYLFAYIYAKHLYNEFLATEDDQEGGQEDGIGMADFQKQFMIWLSCLPSGPREKIRLEIENMKIRFKFEKRRRESFTFWKKNFISEGAIENISNKEYSPNDENNRNPFSADCSEEKLSLDRKDTALISYLCCVIAENTFNALYSQDSENAQYLDAIDYVVYTGRAFDFLPLRDAFEKRMNWERFWRFPYSVRANRTPNHLRARHPKESKSNTVNFASHNLNINLNSDICCLQDLMQNANLNDRNQRNFTQKEIFEGYEDANGNTTFYLGYFGETRVWSRAGVNQGLTSADKALTIMTLYPNARFDARDYDTTMEILQVEDTLIEQIAHGARKAFERLRGIGIFDSKSDSDDDANDNSNVTE